MAETELTGSTKYPRLAAKKPRLAKYGCQMVVGMDLSGEAVGIVFKGDGQFGTIANRVASRLQPGSIYAIAPPHFGSYWRAGGLEILEIHNSEGLIPLKGDVFTAFARGFRDVLPDGPHFATCMLRNCIVEHLIASDTTAYEGCGNSNCESITRVESHTCPHCPMEANRKKKYYSFHLSVGIDCGQQVSYDLEFSGKPALRMVAPDLLQSNPTWPLFFQFNQTIQQAVPPGTRLDVLLWQRGTEGDDRSASVPLRHVVLFRRSDGAEWHVKPTPIPEPQALAAQFTFSSPQKSPARASRPGPPGTPCEIVPLDNPAKYLCATNTLLQLLVATPSMVAAIAFMKDQPVQYPTLFPAMWRCTSAMMSQKQPPSARVRDALHRSMQIALANRTETAADGMDIWGDVNEFWRLVFSFVMQGPISLFVSHIILSSRITCPQGHVHESCDATSCSTGIEVAAARGTLEEALESIQAEENIQWKCVECGCEVQASRTVRIGVLGDVLPILVTHADEGSQFMVPRSFRLAEQTWVVTGIAEHIADHWIAHVVARGGVLWTANDETSHVVPSGQFPAGKVALILAQQENGSRLTHAALLASTGGEVRAESTL